MPRSTREGLAALASWIVWPVVFFTAYWLGSIVFQTGRRCSIEGCDPPDGLLGWLWLAAMFGPPLYLTYRWARNRRLR